MDCVHAVSFRCPVSLSSANLRPSHLAGLGGSLPHRKLSSSRYLGGAALQPTRCAAIHFPQEWLTREREDEWGFGQQKVVQASVQSKGVPSLLLQAAYRAIYIALRLTAMAFHMVHNIVTDVRRALWWQERTARARAELAAQQRRAEEERLLGQCREEQIRMSSEADHAQFIRILKTMDDPNIPLETKWAAIAKQLGSKEEFRQQLSSLFTLAGESSRAVLEMSSNSAAFWKSEHTRSVIAQEEALKRHLYLQMLHGSTA